MNWQLLQNVNCPIEKLLLIVFLDEDAQRDCCFAYRRKDGIMNFGRSPEEAISDPDVYIPYEDLINTDPEDTPFYWTLFVWP